jgi:hypothetical protein
MRSAAYAAIALGCAWMGACLDLGAFACERHDQCALGGRSGQCTDDGHCAFDDDACESGLRYHDSAASDLAGDCVPVPVPSGSTGPEPPSSTSDTGGSSGASLGSSSSDEGEGDSLPVDPSTSTGAESCGDHPCPCATAIAAGDSSMCALRQGGSLVCWGENDDDQLGSIGKVDESPWPLPAAFPAGVGITEVIAGNDHFCARAEVGDVYCWGRNVEGMAVPDLAPADVAPPALLDWLRGVGPLSLGPQLTCGTDGTGIGVVCWGGGELGELGVLDEVDPPGPGPLPIGAPLDTAAIDEIAAGRDHACALTAGEVLCWGTNQNGQLGDGGPVDPDPLPGPVVLPAPVERIVAGRRHTCAVLEPGDEVHCWGRNDFGQVGADTTTFKHITPVPIAARLDGVVVDIRAMLDGTCLLTEPGTILCWGSNGADKLGLGGAVEETAVPVALDVIDELPEPVVEIAVGDAHICARTETGRVFCWGDDTFEQLGPVDPAPGLRSVEIDLECVPR